MLVNLFIQAYVIVYMVGIKHVSTCKSNIMPNHQESKECHLHLVGIRSSLTSIDMSNAMTKQEPTHRKVGSKPHPARRGFLSMVGPTGSNSRWIAQCWFFFSFLLCYASMFSSFAPQVFSLDCKCKNILHKVDMNNLASHEWHLMYFVSHTRGIWKHINIWVC